MEIMKVVRQIYLVLKPIYRVFSAIGEIGSFLWLLVLFGVIEVPIHGADFLIAYRTDFIVVALAAFWIFSLWIGYQIRAWRNARLRTIAVEPPEDSEPHSPRQLEYRSEVRDDLSRIEVGLYEIERPMDVQFESWNAFPKPDPRPLDLHNPTQFQAIENFSTALNLRNKYVNTRDWSITLGRFDPEFMRLNTRCIAMYDKITESGFIDEDDQTTGLPRLVIAPEDVELTGEEKTVEVRFPNGEKRIHKVRFYYVTVRAKGQRTVENVTASCDGNRLRIIPKNTKPSFGVDWNGYSITKFDEDGAYSFVIAIIREERKTKEEIRFVHPGSGQTFVLFFTVEGRGDFYLPATTYLPYNTRTGYARDNGTGTVKLSLHLEGQDKWCDATFEVAFENWASFRVKLAKSS